MRFGLHCFAAAACLWACCAAHGQSPVAYDADTKRYEAAPGEEYAHYSFYITNTSTHDVIVDRVKGSCGCTTVDLPPQPWVLSPRESGEIKARIHLIGKTGLISKTLTNYCRLAPDNKPFESVVTLEVNVPPPPALAGKFTEAERAVAMEKAKHDAQAIFHGECATCHADRGAEKFGQDLYVVDCGICHESSRRASSVPDLHALKAETDYAYWKAIITNGKAHTMMPPFGESEGGPLTDAQIESLAKYLDHTISHHLTTAQQTALSQ